MNGRTGRLVALVWVAVLLGPVPAARATPPAPAEMRVEGGEEAWHAERAFRLLWRNATPLDGSTVAAVRYLVRDPAGAVAIGERRIGWPATSIENLEVPGSPGTYTAEVRLEDEDGGVGPPTVAQLRFDDARPGSVEPLSGATWIGRSAFPLSIRLGHPSGPLPVSGIRGYAVSVAPTPGTGPCAAIDRCTDAETDLRGGVADDTYRIADLPEGTSHLEAVAVSGSGVASGAAGGATLRVDKTSPVTGLTGLPTGWANRPVELTAMATDAASGMVADGRAPTPFTAIAIDARAPTVASGDSVTATVIGEGVHSVAHYARDLAGNVDDGAASNGVSNPAPAWAVVRIDRTPPSVSFANSQSTVDPELIRAGIHDPLSGPDPERGWIGVRRAGSGDRFAPLPAAPSGDGELRARWDSDAYPAGEYEFRAVGHDAAGNVAATTRRADGRPMVLSSPLKAKTVLDAGFNAVNRESAGAVPYGRPILFAGRLTAGLSAPLGGVPVRIVERFAAPAQPAVRITVATTDGDGRFAVPLASGPSREVTAVYDGTPTLSRASSPTKRLGVRSGVRLKASSGVARVGGPPLVLAGRVGAAAGTIPPEGKSVQLQFRAAGLPWSEFRTIQTDRRGRFRYAYRFSDDDSRGVLFRFRAVAPAQSGWAYEPSRSRPVSVRGI